MISKDKIQDELVKVMEHYEGVIQSDYFDNPNKWSKITGTDNPLVNHMIYTWVFNAPHDILMNLSQEEVESMTSQAMSDEEFWNITPVPA